MPAADSAQRLCRARAVHYSARVVSGGSWERGAVRLSSALFTWRAAPGSHRVAVRVMLVLLVALSTLLWLGRIDLAPYASFGA